MSTEPPPSGARPTGKLLLALAAIAATAPHAVVKTIDETVFRLHSGLEPAVLAEEISLLARFTLEEAEDWREDLRWEEGSDGADPGALKMRADHYRRMERVLRGEDP